MHLFNQIEDHGWKIVKKDNQFFVKTEYDATYGLFKIKHPALVHLNIYKVHEDPDIRYKHFKIAHDLFWPKAVWHPWTERRFRAHCENYNYITLAAGASATKAQPLTAKIHTPNGWTTMGELKVGSEITDIYGNSQTVTAIHPQGIKPLYRITFSDGSFTEATADHLWAVKTKKDRDRYRLFRVMTTEEISENLKHRICVPAHAPIPGTDKFLPIHPWLLGYYIGNGCLAKKSSATITCPNEHYVEKVKAHWPDCSIKKYKDRNCYLLLLRGFRTLLACLPEVAFKKSTEKAIPVQYLTSSIESRKQLLQGLIDSDGTNQRTENDGMRIAFSNERLRDQTVELARSLGLYVSSAPPKKTHYLKDGIRFSCEDSYSLYINAKRRHRVITSIEYVRDDYAQCITVSSADRLYLTDHFIPTHNSYDAAKIAILFFWAAPDERNVTIASVTMNSLAQRVWGYLLSHFENLAIDLPYKYLSANPPKIVLKSHQTDKDKVRENLLHGIFAVTAKQGDSQQAVATWIGKHPKDKILLILDECTDMPMTILKALDNLNSHPDKFQLIGIGNSSSKLDLHGTLSTPKNGWNSVSPDLTEWRTTQLNGICLYFNPYDSPAITDPDPERRKILSKFLIGKENLEEKIARLGTDSEEFYRWVLGFWKPSTAEEVVITEEFLNDPTFYDKATVEWSGLFPIERVACFDPAFSRGGDKAIFRVLLIGHTMNGLIKIDVGKGDRMWDLKRSAISGIPIERQLAEQILDLLILWRIPLGRLGLDASGQGRAIGEVVWQISKQRNHPVGTDMPLKVVSIKQRNLQKVHKIRKIQDPSEITVSAFDQWNDIRRYVEHNNISGLDPVTHFQLTNRRIEGDVSAGKLTLETKAEYKRRISAITKGHSPDEADALAVGIQVVKHRLGIRPGDVWTRSEGTLPDYTSYVEMQSQMQEMYAPRKVSHVEMDFSGDMVAFLKNSRPF